VILRRGEFCFADAGLQADFAAAMQQNGARAAEVVLSSGALQVRLLLPEQVQGAADESGAAAHAVVVLTRRGADEGVRRALAVGFGLTAAETTIALLLAAGLSTAEISAARQASLNTVRNQIKAILSKTGCRRQSEVVALVLRTERA
jgi:DNA-binding CsgD family transcriptional regulator